MAALAHRGIMSPRRLACSPLLVASTSIPDILFRPRLVHTLSIPCLPDDEQGCCAAISLTCIGAAYGTAKSGVGISAMSILRPDLMMKCVVPVIMAGIIAIVSHAAAFPRDERLDADPGNHGIAVRIGRLGPYLG